MNKIEQLKSIIKHDAVRFGKFTLSSGKESDLYVDLRKVTLNPMGASIIGELTNELIRDRRVDAVGGMSIGADPIATAVSLAAYREGREIMAFLVRKTQKAHGTGNVIEGPINQGMRALVVEDVITTGASTISAIERVREAGMEVELVVAIFDRCEGGREAIEALGVEVRSLLTRNDL
ncbi:MAG TPA: orotate phosphoribosyltransferase [Deltaproteobacteria bacterium]|nr:orotate phosphoribosyltransferase [Deltaproteobacteria bacterium]HPR56666.1 orotate phosphoribosyltransferase [Deltaproteobacteria bacterium]HXK47971.1 orotate phosphoribosyltransferase [Deltaproteobacteria bacterium]